MKILLADDHRLVREGVRALLEREGFEIVGEASSGREAIDLFETARPDLVILDVFMPGLNGVDATRQLLASAPKAKIIGLSMNADRRAVLNMLAAGASGYLLKTSTAEELVRAVREVGAGNKYVSPAVTGTVLEHVVEGAREPSLSSPAGLPAAKTLTSREREVLQLVAEGSSSKDIAAKLDVAVATVETHRRQIMDKLGLRTIADLTKYAIREGLTTID